MNSTCGFQNVITRQPQGILSRFLPFGRGNRRSGLNQEVPNLAILAMDSFLRHIERKLENPLLKVTIMNSLKSYYQLHIPPKLRQEMLDYILSSGRIYNNVDINFFEFLMDSQIR